MTKNIKKLTEQFIKGEDIKNSQVEFILTFISEFFEDKEEKILSKNLKKKFSDLIEANLPRGSREIYERLFNEIISELAVGDYVCQRGSKFVKVKGRFFDNVKGSENIGKHINDAIPIVDAMKSRLQDETCSIKSVKDKLNIYFILLAHLTLDSQYIEGIPSKLLKLDVKQVCLSDRRIYFDGDEFSQYMIFSEAAQTVFELLIKGKEGDEKLFSGLSSLPESEISNQLMIWLNKGKNKKKEYKTKTFFKNPYKMFKLYFDCPLAVTAGSSGRSNGYIGTDLKSEKAFLFDKSCSLIVDEETQDLTERDLYQLQVREEYKESVQKNEDQVSLADSLIRRMMLKAHKKPSASQNKKLAEEFKTIIDAEKDKFNDSPVGQALKSLVAYVQQLAFTRRASSIKTYYYQLKVIIIVAARDKKLSVFTQEDWNEVAKMFGKYYSSDYSGKLVDFIKFLTFEGIIEEQDTKLLYSCYNSAMIKEEKAKVQPLFAPSEIKRIYLSLKESGDVFGLWFFCLGLCGLRAEECFLLNKYSLTARKSINGVITQIELRVLGSKTRNGTFRVIPLHLMLPPIIFREFSLMIQKRMKHLKNNDNLPLIPFERPGFNFAKCSSGEKVNELSKVIRTVRKAVCLRKGLRFHTLRHYSITSLAVRLAEFILQEKIQTVDDSTWLSIPESTVQEFIGYQDNDDHLRYLGARNLFGIVSLIAGHGNSSTTANVYMNIMPYFLKRLRESNFMEKIQNSLYR